MANGDKTSATATVYNYSWTNQNILSYVKNLTNHRINATAVFEQMYSDDFIHKTEAKAG